MTSSRQIEPTLTPRFPLLVAVGIFILAALTLMYPMFSGKIVGGSDQILVVSELSVTAPLAAGALSKEIEADLPDRAHTGVILNRTARRTPTSSTRSSSRPRYGPSPTTNNIASGTALTIAGIALTSTSCPLRGTNRDTHTTTRRPTKSSRRRTASPDPAAC